MTYDVSCYKPISSLPSVEEAQRVLGAGYDFPPLEREPDPDEMWKIAAALLKFDRRLEPFKLDPTKLAAMTIDPAERIKVDHIELNSAKGELAIQLEIFPDSVGVTIPYWYHGTEVGEVFGRVSAYLRVIGEASGYFVYDPQKEVAYDPVKMEPGGRSVYAEVADILPRVISDAAAKNKDAFEPQDEL